MKFFLKLMQKCMLKFVLLHCYVFQNLNAIFNFFPLGETIASTAVFVIMSGSDGQAETLLETAK